MEENPVIQSQRALVAKLRAELHTAEAVLQGMELVESSYVQQRVISKVQTRAPNPLERSLESPQAGGKPKGSISMNWRKVLASFYAHDQRFSAADTVARELELNNRSLQQRAVRRLFDGYIDLGFLELDNGLYRVTDTAAVRFGFDRAPLAEREVNEAEGALEVNASASSLFTGREGGDGHEANIA